MAGPFFLALPDQDIVSLVRDEICGNRSREARIVELDSDVGVILLARMSPTSADFDTTSHNPKIRCFVARLVFDLFNADFRVDRQGFQSALKAAVILFLEDADSRHFSVPF